jgi:hypothetical protein
MEREVSLDYWTLRAIPPSNPAEPMRFRLKGEITSDEQLRGETAITSPVVERLAQDIVRTETGRIYRLGRVGTWAALSTAFPYFS